MQSVAKMLDESTPLATVNLLGREYSMHELRFDRYVITVDGAPCEHRSTSTDIESCLLARLEGELGGFIMRKLDEMVELYTHGDNIGVANVVGEIVDARKRLMLVAKGDLEALEELP
jgi:hypothetical protein